MVGGHIWPYGGHHSGTLLLFARTSRQTLATCGRALSAVKSADIAAREELQRGRGSHLCTLLPAYEPESGADQRTDGGHEATLTQSISHSFWRHA